MLRSPRFLLIAAPTAVLTVLALAGDRLTLIPLPFQWGNQRVLVRSNGGFLMNGNTLRVSGLPDACRPPYGCCCAVWVAMQPRRDQAIAYSSGRGLPWR